MTNGKTYTIDILTVYQSEKTIGNAKSPLTKVGIEINIDEAIKSIILNIFGNFTFDEIEAEHVNYWKRLYDNSDISVIPKQEI